MSTMPANPSRRRIVLGVLIFAQLLIWLDGTILTTAFETLADPVKGLGATPGQLQWATGSYALVLTTVTFAGGALGDRFGHRNVLLAGMALFGLASAGAAYAQNMTELIAVRALMGVGAALLVPATLAVVSWTFEPAERPAAFGVLSSFAGVGIALGPVAAGVLLANFWWGSVFLVNVPVVLVGLLAIARYVPNFRNPQARSLDLGGLALSAAGLGALAYGLIRAGQDGSVTETLVLAPVLVGLVLLAVFVVVELRVPHPSFNPRLFRERRFALGNTALTLMFLVISAGGFMFTFYLQGVRAYSAMHASLIALPGAAGVMLGGPLGVRLVRRAGSLRIVSGSAFVVLAADMAAYATFGQSTPIWLYMLLGIVMGASSGIVIAPLTGAVLGSVPLDQAGAGSAVNSTMRQTGSVLGIAFGGTAMALVYRHAVRGGVAALPAPQRRQAQTSAELARHVAALRHDPALVTRANDAFLHAMHVTLVWTVGFLLVGAVLVAVGFPRPRAAGPSEAAPESVEPRVSVDI